MAKSNGKKSNRRLKIAVVVMALIIAAFSTLAVFEYITPYKPSNGFKRPGAAEKEENFGDNMTFESEEPGGAMRLSSEAVVGENNQTVQRITATVTPADAVNAHIEWTIAWSEETGSWGNMTKGAVTEYLRMNPDSTTLVNEVTCLKPFGTKAVITASVLGNTSLTKTCTIGYNQGVESAEINFSWSLPATPTVTEGSWTLSTKTQGVTKFEFPSDATFQALKTLKKSITVKPVFTAVYTNQLLEGNETQKGAPLYFKSYPTAEYVKFITDNGIRSGNDEAVAAGRSIFNHGRCPWNASEKAFIVSAVENGDSMNDILYLSRNLPKIKTVFLQTPQAQMFEFEIKFSNRSVFRMPVTFEVTGTLATDNTLSDDTITFGPSI